VQELVSTGHITEAEARNHPRRNIVTRALGIEPTVRVDTEVLPIVRGDRFVLCSDGLVDEASDDDIANLIVANANPQACAQALIELANSMGGRDNTTVVVVDVLTGTSGHTAGTESDAVLEPVTDPSGEVPVPMQVEADPEPTPSGVQRPATRASRRMVGAGIAAAAVAIGVVLALTVGASSSPAPTTTTTSTSTTQPASTSSSSTSTSTSTTVATSGA
jgi:hypothetical protein